MDFSRFQYCTQLNVFYSEGICAYRHFKVQILHIVSLTTNISLVVALEEKHKEISTYD